METFVLLLVSVCVNFERNNMNERRSQINYEWRSSRLNFTFFPLTRDVKQLFVIEWSVISG